MDKDKIADMVSRLTNEELEHLMGALAYSFAKNGPYIYKWTDKDKKQVYVKISVLGEVLA